MPNILIRDVPEETKRLLEERAKANGRSQNAEAVAILQKELQPAKKTWFDMLMETVEEVGPVELELPERHPGRKPPFDWMADAQ
ncbi:MAG: Arc family DNA-binding protein [Eggerthellaceae bacterium]|nr:Arc family DNA-binding protein [Eggerthellaceae bacterium]